MNRPIHSPIIIAFVIAMFAALALAMAGPAGAAGEKSDVWMEAQLSTTYALNEHLNPFNINVDVTNGVVILTGEVESDVDRDLAGQIAQGMEGISQVRNNLTVAPQAPTVRSEENATFMSRVNDATISAKVKSNLLWNRNTSGLKIDVDTSGGVVTLTGVVESEVRRALSIRLAENTSGVRRVVDRLVVGSEAEKDEGIGEKMGAAARKAGQAATDTWITSKVKTVLLFNKRADGTDINVTTNDGVVTLEGVVSSPGQADYIGDVVKDVVNVNSVDNRLKIARGVAEM